MLRSGVSHPFSSVACTKACAERRVAGQRSVWGGRDFGGPWSSLRRETGLETRWSRVFSWENDGKWGVKNHEKKTMETPGQIFDPLEWSRNKKSWFFRWFSGPWLKPWKPSILVIWRVFVVKHKFSSKFGYLILRITVGHLKWQTNSVRVLRWALMEPLSGAWAMKALDRCLCFWFPIGLRSWKVEQTFETSQRETQKLCNRSWP